MAIADRGFDILVVSQPDSPRGRKLRVLPSPIAEAALLLDIPLIRPEDINSPETIQIIRDFSPRIIVTASYGAMLKREIRSLPPLGAVNIHPSLLPLYRGASPIRSALLDGMDSTGVTLFKMTARMDAGPILLQQTIPILPQDDHSSMHQLLSTLSATVLLHYLDHFAVIDPVPQDDSQASFCHKFTREDARIQWNQPVQHVFNRVRAFAEDPGAFCGFRDSQIKILAASMLDAPASGIPGSIANIVKNRGFSVNCADRQLFINKVQPAGKAAMESWAFHLGARLAVGECMGCEP